mmetsp:Transcript_143660/g.364648  ORF Transcript_143660/g.364648 Transcript_143660/m.364648 type:complete len:204 (-) Transcript_143660:613-1224(-)
MHSRNHNSAPSLSGTMSYAFPLPAAVQAKSVKLTGTALTSAPPIAVRGSAYAPCVNDTALTIAPPIMHPRPPVPPIVLGKEHKYCPTPAPVQSLPPAGIHRAIVPPVVSVRHGLPAVPPTLRSCGKFAARALALLINWPTCTPMPRPMKFRGRDSHRRGHLRPTAGSSIMLLGQELDLTRYKAPDFVLAEIHQLLVVRSQSLH